MSAAHNGPTPPQSSSDSAFSKSHAQSIRSYAHGTVRTVVTAPPWARDEPPSPKDELPPSATKERSTDSRPSENRPSDVASYQSSYVDENEAGPSRWWAFTRYRPDDSSSQPLAMHGARHGRDRSLSMAWLTSTITRRSTEQEGGSGKEKTSDNAYQANSPRRASPADNLHIDLPPNTPSPITLAQTRTPGWDVPWSPRAPGERVDTWDRDPDEAGDERDNDNEKHGVWQKRKKRIRVYMLTNAYVPLLFRFVNITLTASAMAIGIRIRVVERRSHIMGALGSSPTLVVIFAPLTLVHVMIAIYVEYFGRPLGLWRTSSKLAHTLVEVVFICAWSAALALSFDNFFTSTIPCASPSATSWYSNLPRDTLPGFNGSSGVGGTLCNEQLALICLVGVGLIMYCFNLVISLYRIFEKVKYHPSSHA